MKFSQRIGRNPVREILQIDSVDEDLSNALWNCILTNFIEKLDGHNLYNKDLIKYSFCKEVWENFYKRRTDEIPSYGKGLLNHSGVFKFIKFKFFTSKWYEKYDLVEFISQFSSNISEINFTEKCNHVLKTEMSSYRVINNRITQITGEEEVKEIEKAFSINEKFSSTSVHLKTALDLLSNRKKPDFRNSIKESISAVESFCKILTGENNTTLGKALQVIEKDYQLHGSLKKSFAALYGYTSASGGIRHALLQEDVEVTHEEARFMLISCSAFINYLKSKC